MTDMPEKTLKPCPFCGGKAELWRAQEDRTAWIACMGRCSVLVSKEYKTDDNAIAAWNTRSGIEWNEALEAAAKANDDKFVSYANTERIDRYALGYAGACRDFKAAIRAMKREPK